MLTASLPPREVCCAADGPGRRNLPGGRAIPGITGGSSASGKSGKNKLSHTRLWLRPELRDWNSHGIDDICNKETVMKKLLTLAVVLCLSVAVIGCGSDDGKTKKTTTTSSTTKTS